VFDLAGLPGPSGEMEAVGKGLVERVLAYDVTNDVAQRVVSGLSR
jgi:hypothetical protein